MHKSQPSVSSLSPSEEDIGKGEELALALQFPLARKVSPCQEKGSQLTITVFLLGLHLSVVLGSKLPYWHLLTKPKHSLPRSSVGRELRTRIHHLLLRDSHDRFAAQEFIVHNQFSARRYRRKCKLVRGSLVIRRIISKCRHK